MASVDAKAYEWIINNLGEDFPFKVKGKGSICSTCKYFNGKNCLKGHRSGGYIEKLSDCDKWEVCNG